MAQGEPSRQEATAANLVPNQLPPAEKQLHETVSTPSSPKGSSRAPTERDLAELYTLLLRDIQKWSQARGFSSVPPIIFLRQIADYSDAMGSVLYQDRGQDAAR